MKLSLDSWQGNRASFEETEDPDTAQILEAVDKLDSKNHTEVSLNREEPFEYLTISGGPKYFLVSGEGRDGSFVQLTSPDAGEDSITLVCGGQSADFAMHEVVPRDDVDGAVEQFFDGLSADLPHPWTVS